MGVYRSGHVLAAVWSPGPSCCPRSLVAFLRSGEPLLALWRGLRLAVGVYQPRHMAHRPRRRMFMTQEVHALIEVRDPGCCPG
jgi:hypothetical protein